eukprot:COSAG04_NODE_6902_length_1232_cov_1.360989_2_plen_32_part_00
MSVAPMVSGSSPPVSAFVSVSDCDILLWAVP